MNLDDLNMGAASVASAARDDKNGNAEIMAGENGTRAVDDRPKRRPPGVPAHTSGKRRRMGSATGVMIYPTPATKKVIVEGSRVAKKSMSTFCVISAVKETAVLLGRPIDDLGIPPEDLRRLHLEETRTQNKKPAASKS